MISKTCHIAYFIKVVVDKPYADIIAMANQEATLAERRCRRRCGRIPDDNACCTRYSEQLKCLIYYLRYYVRPGGIKASEFELFQKLIDPQRTLQRHRLSRSMGHDVFYVSQPRDAA